MTMEPSDRDLLHRFTTQHDEAAFTLLVRRHLDLVRATALRITGRDDLARDAAQSAFIRLARRAGTVPKDLALVAWLHRTSRSLAIDIVRAENRRRKHESRAAANSAILEDAASDPEWTLISPVIDSLVDRLDDRDREILLLRYFENHTFASAAHALGLKEQAARKRAERALERLRALLQSQGIATSSAALAIVLPSHAAIPSPAGLAAAVATHSTASLSAAGSLARLSIITAAQKAIATSFLALFLLGVIIVSSIHFASAESAPASLVPEHPSEPNSSTTAAIAPSEQAKAITPSAPRPELSDSIPDRFSLSDDRKTLKRERFNKSGNAVLTIVYRLDDIGHAIRSDSFDANGEKLSLSIYGYTAQTSPTHGQLLFEQAFASRTKHADPGTGNEVPAYRFIYRYNGDGSPKRPVAVSVVKPTDEDVEYVGPTGLTFDPLAK